MDHNFDVLMGEMQKSLNEVGLRQSADKVSKARRALPIVTTFVNSAYIDWAEEKKEQRIFDIIRTLV